MTAHETTPLVKSSTRLSEFGYSDREPDHGMSWSATPRRRTRCWIVGCIIITCVVTFVILQGFRMKSTISSSSSNQVVAVKNLESSLDLPPMTQCTSACGLDPSFLLPSSQHTLSSRWIVPAQEEQSLADSDSSLHSLTFQNLGNVKIQFHGQMPDQDPQLVIWNVNRVCREESWTLPYFDIYVDLSDNTATIHSKVPCYASYEIGLDRRQCHDRPQAQLCVQSSASSSWRSLMFQEHAVVQLRHVKASVVSFYSTTSDSVLAHLDISTALSFYGQVSDTAITHVETYMLSFATDVHNISLHDVLLTGGVTFSGTTRRLDLDRVAMQDFMLFRKTLADSRLTLDCLEGKCNFVTDALVENTQVVLVGFQGTYSVGVGYYTCLHCRVYIDGVEQSPEPHMSSYVGRVGNGTAQVNIGAAINFKLYFNSTRRRLDTIEPRTQPPDIHNTSPFCIATNATSTSADGEHHHLDLPECVLQVVVPRSSADIIQNGRAMDKRTPDRLTWCLALALLWIDLGVV